MKAKRAKGKKGTGKPAAKVLTLAHVIAALKNMEREAQDVRYALESLGQPERQLKPESRETLRLLATPKVQEGEGCECEA